MLGSKSFNLCVADMSGTVNNGERLQYADDTTIYQHCKVKNIKHTINRLQKELTHLLKW